MGAMSEVENAVNSGILVEQAKTRVVLAREALRIANFALDQTDQRLKETKVKAPRDGLIQEVFVREGQIISSGITSVTGGTPLMMLADVTKLYIEADVDEADIGRVRELAPADRSARLGFLDKVPGSIAGTPPPPATGDPEKMAMLRSSNKVDITVEASREETFTGKIDRVYPDPKIVNNIVTYKVNILLTGDNRSKLLTGEYRKKLMLGMHANVKFTSRKLTNVLKVVNEAIRVKNEEHGVYIEGPDKKPLFVPVKVGLTDGTMNELKTDKLKEKQQVYIKLPTSKDGEEGKVDDN